MVILVIVDIIPAIPLLLINILLINIVLSRVGYFGIKLI